MTRAKKARSDFRGGQGRVPRRPMPREGVVATMRVSGGRGRGGIGVGDIVVVVGEWRVEREGGERLRRGKYSIWRILGCLLYCLATT